MDVLDLLHLRGLRDLMDGLLGKRDGLWLVLLNVLNGLSLNNLWMLKNLGFLLLNYARSWLNNIPWFIDY